MQCIRKADSAGLGNYTPGMRTAMLSILILLCGCTGDGGDGKRLKMTVKERREAAESIVSRTPESRSYRYDNGELRVLEIPSMDSRGYVDVQRCFIWRDTEYRTSTMQCPADQTSAPTLQGPEPDYTR